MQHFLALAVCLIAAPALAQPNSVLPDQRLTPGATIPVTREVLCVPGYTRHARHVSRRTRRRVFREYGLSGADRRAYEVDHLIPLSLGGSNDLENLWPQSRLTPAWNAAAKDRLEETLHVEMCAGAISLDEAQTAIRTDWTAAYRRYEPGTGPYSVS